MTDFVNMVLNFLSMVIDVTVLIFSDEDMYAYIGYAAGLATVSAFAFQTVRILRAKNVSGLSSYMYTMYSLSLVCWFTYGVSIDAWILALANLVTFLFTFLILLLILYYDEEDKIERYRRDPLTYIFNKTYYEESVPSKIAESVLNKQPFSIITGQIDNLDDITEKMGGKYRNRALKYAAKTLEKALRDSDFIARIDDNLFAIYLANTDGNIALKVTQRVWESVNGVVVQKSKEAINIQMHFGICSSTKEEKLDVLTQKAIDAMSGVRANSNSKIRLYQEEKKNTAKKEKVIAKKPAVKQEEKPAKAVAEDTKKPDNVKTVEKAENKSVVKKEKKAVAKKVAAPKASKKKQNTTKK